MRRVTSVSGRLVAPCGINCARCLGYLRDKNTCPGCRFLADTRDKKIYRSGCVIKYCTKRSDDFCGSCTALPCRRLKDLDKRYRTRYATPLIDNLLFIRDQGIRAFLRKEKTEDACPQCGAVLSIHRSTCLKCGFQWRTSP